MSATNDSACRKHDAYRLPVLSRRLRRARPGRRPAAQATLRPLRRRLHRCGQRTGCTTAPRTGANARGPARARGGAAAGSDHGHCEAACAGQAPRRFTARASLVAGLVGGDLARADHAGLAGVCAGVRGFEVCEVSKRFFFEKPKNFSSWVPVSGKVRDSRHKSVLLLSFRKEGLAYPVLTPSSPLPSMRTRSASAIARHPSVG